MNKKLQITLSEEATKKYLEWASARVNAEFDEDIEPSSCIINVEISSLWGSTAYGQSAKEPIEFGDVEIAWI